jgi:nucleotide-binding universal stress UspA family protein
MATLELKPSHLVVHLHGWNILHALRGSVSIPLSHVEGVRLAPPEAFYDDVIVEAWRGVGTYAPGQYCIGTVQLADGRSFFDVRRPERALAIDLVGDPLRHIVVEPDDESPEHAARRIRLGLREWSRDALDDAEPITQRDPTPVVVVGVDLSPLSQHLITAVRDLVSVHETVHVHVVHARVPVSPPTEMGNLHLVDAFHDAHAEAALEELCAPLRATPGVKVTTHLRLGSAAEELTRVAKDLGAQLIVVEAHGRQGLDRLFHRSLVAKLARSAPCSVLTLRPTAPRSS